MILDPNNRQICAINALYPLRNKEVLEIGCGKGRLTRDLAKVAKRVVACDPDEPALAHAEANILSDNLEFLAAPDGIPSLPENSFDLAIYTLSLHHVPTDKMLSSLQTASKLVKRSGAIMVLEPGDGGTFNEAKRRFDIGSGDEQTEKQAAIQAMQNLAGWRLSEDHCFEAAFLFSDKDDFYLSKLPDFKQLPARKQQQIEAFLQKHKTAEGILLTTERRLNLLQRTTDC